MTRYRTEIIADRVQFGPKGSGTRDDGFDDQPAAPAAEPVEDQPVSKGFDYPAETIDPADMPF